MNAHSSPVIVAGWGVLYWNVSYWNVSREDTANLAGGGGDAPPTTPCGAAKINHYMLCHYGLWILVRLKDDTTTYWVVTFADEVTPREHFDP